MVQSLPSPDYHGLRDPHSIPQGLAHSELVCVCVANTNMCVHLVGSYSTTNSMLWRYFLLQTLYFAGVILNVGLNFALKHIIKEPRPTAGSYVLYCTCVYVCACMHPLARLAMGVWLQVGQYLCYVRSILWCCNLVLFATSLSVFSSQNYPATLY